MVLIVNKYTSELAHKQAELAYEECRKAIVEMIKKATPKWKERYIQTFNEGERPLTEQELKCINS